MCTQDKDEDEAEGEEKEEEEEDIKWTLEIPDHLFSKN